MMQRSAAMLRVVQALACLLVGKTVVVVLLNYRDYFPANFRSDFLLGRSGYFFGTYQWAFYAHIVTGPIVLVTGLVLLSDFMRHRFPVWHRRLGRFHVLCMLLVVAPSGLWMAWYAVTGTVAAIGFAALAILTAWCAAKGWQAAVRQRFVEHRMWMQRCYVLLCSAVVLRVMGGLADVLGAGGTYHVAAWASWLVPLVVFESLRLTSRSLRFPKL